MSSKDKAASERTSRRGLVVLVLPFCAGGNLEDFSRTHINVYRSFLPVGQRPVPNKEQQKKRRPGLGRRLCLPEMSIARWIEAITKQNARDRVKMRLALRLLGVAERAIRFDDVGQVVQIGLSSCCRVGFSFFFERYQRRCWLEFREFRRGPADDLAPWKLLVGRCRGAYGVRPRCVERCLDALFRVIDLYATWRERNFRFVGDGSYWVFHLNFLPLE